MWFTARFSIIAVVFLPSSGGLSTSLEPSDYLKVECSEELEEGVSHDHLTENTYQ